MAAIETAEAKLRGGYYTPDVLADFLVRWAVGRRKSIKVLEPSAGDGAFIRALTGVSGVAIEADAIELYPDEARKISEGSPSWVHVSDGDVFRWYADANRDGYYDAVVGNPPFIRYQSFPEAHREPGFRLMADEGLSPNRLTNAWVPFVVLATRALKPGGRLAMVLPAELLQVTYAGELRSYLAQNFEQLTVVTFRRLVFADIQQETVLVLGVRRADVQASMSFIELDDLKGLTSTVVAKSPGVPVDLDHAREKWTQYYLSSAELGLVREIEASDAFTTLGEIADVNVGIVTGRNEFFVLTPSQADELGVRDHCLPLVGRSAQIPGLILRPDQWDDLAEGDGRCLLLQLGPTDRADLDPAALAYVKQGEAAEYHNGFKCRIRLPNWWNVPSTRIPDAFLLRQIHDGPRIIVNEAAATCTDTIHRVWALGDTDPRWLAAASVNSLTFAFSEIRGRSYGGGVLELEPTEAEGLLFPKPGGTLPLDEFDLWARRKGSEDLLAEVDRHVLVNAGLTEAEVLMLREIWHRLYGRRLNRKRR